MYQVFWITKNVNLCLTKLNHYSDQPYFKSTYNLQYEDGFQAL